VFHPDDYMETPLFPAAAQWRWSEVHCPGCKDLGQNAHPDLLGNPGAARIGAVLRPWRRSARIEDLIGIQGAESVWTCRTLSRAELLPRVRHYGL
jgi:hypothetical protein